jgi:hypothetical protein
MGEEGVGVQGRGARRRERITAAEKEHTESETQEQTPRLTLLLAAAQGFG